METFTGHRKLAGWQSMVHSVAVHWIMCSTAIGLITPLHANSNAELPKGQPIDRLLQGGDWRGMNGGHDKPISSSRKIYQTAFSEQSIKRDWVAEGPVKWKVKDGALQLESILTESFLQAYRKNQFSWIPQNGMQEYFTTLDSLAKNKLKPELYQRCLEADGSFKGGHVVIWNNKPLPENYVIEFDTSFQSEMGLFILFFSAEKTGGGSIFDPGLAERYGVFSQYTRGEIQSYHVSSYTPQRGTTHVRKNPGGKMLYSAPDLACLAPGLTYRYRLIKWGNRFQYYLNDQLQADVVDSKEHPLKGGFVGLRLMAGCRATFSNFTTSELLHSPFSIKPPAETVIVNKVNSPADVKNLQSICNAASPGTTIMLPEGQLKDVQLHIRSKGTADQPINIVAGKNTTFTGTPHINVSGSWITLNGFRFQNGSRPDNSQQVTQRGNKVGGQLPPLITLMGEHNRLTNCHIDRFDKHHNVWLWVKGRHNRVDHGSFTGKFTHGSILNVDPTPDGSWHRIDHNYFSRPKINSDAASVIRVGHGHIAKQPGYICVEHNLFDRCDGENEIVSDKCTSNTFRHNTFRDSKGGLSLRHGSRSHVYGNWFVNCRNGISIRHGGHIIENNQFDLPHSPAIELSRGQPEGFLKRLSHVQAHDTVIRRNTFWVGTNPVFTIPEIDQNLKRRKVVLPEAITIEHNLLYSNGNGQMWSGEIPAKSSIRNNLGVGFSNHRLLSPSPGSWQLDKSADGGFSVSSKKATEGFGSLSAETPPLRHVSR